MSFNPIPTPTEYRKTFSLCLQALSPLPIRDYENEYRNKKFSAVSHGTVTRHLTWFLQTVTEYPQRKTIPGIKSPPLLRFFPWLFKLSLHQQNKEKCHRRVPTRRVETEDCDGSREWKFIKQEREEENKRLQRRRVISFSQFTCQTPQMVYVLFFWVRKREATVFLL